MLDTDAIAAVQKRLDDLPGATDFDTASVLRELNLAQTAVARIPAVKLRYFGGESTTLTVVAGQKEYDLSTLTSSTFPVIERVLYDSTSTAPVQLEWMHPSEIERNQSNQSVLSNHYSVRGNTLYIDGNPDSSEAGKTIKIWYNQTPAAITNSGVETTLLKVCPDLLVDKATAMLALSDDELAGVADRFLNAYERNKDEFLMSLEDQGAAYGQRQVDSWSD